MQSTVASVHFDRPAYQPGEQLSGSVVLHVADAAGINVDGIRLRVEGREFLAFRVGADFEPTTNQKKTLQTSKESLYAKDVALFDDRVMFTPGVYVFPFLVPLERDLSASYRLLPGMPHMDDAQACIWYTATAEVKTPSAPRGVLRSPETEFALIRRTPEPRPITQHMEFTTAKCCCFRRGPILVFASTDSSVYYPGSEVKVQVAVDATGIKFALPESSVALAFGARLQTTLQHVRVLENLMEHKLPDVVPGTRAEFVVSFKVPKYAALTVASARVSMGYDVVVTLGGHSGVSVRLPIVVAPKPAGQPVPVPEAFANAQVIYGSGYPAQGAPAESGEKSKSAGVAPSAAPFSEK